MEFNVDFPTQSLRRGQPRGLQGHKPRVERFLRHPGASIRCESRTPAGVHGFQMGKLKCSNGRYDSCTGSDSYSVASGRGRHNDILHGRDPRAGSDANRRLRAL
jgi:hypothetical protein